MDNHGKEILQVQAAQKGLTETQEKEGIATVDREKRPIFYFVPPAAMSIKGQRGCTENSPACFAGVPD